MTNWKMIPNRETVINLKFKSGNEISDGIIRNRRIFEFSKKSTFPRFEELKQIWKNLITIWNAYIGVVGKSPKKSKEWWNSYWDENVSLNLTFDYGSGINFTGVQHMYIGSAAVPWSLPSTLFCFRTDRDTKLFAFTLDSVRLDSRFAPIASALITIQ